MINDPEDLLFNHGVFLLNGEIDYDNTESIINWILINNFKKSAFTHLTLIINSCGGDLNCAFAIIDIMRGSTIPVHTVGLGQVSSSGLIIFITGKNRILTPNTTILSHQWSGEASGKTHELLSAQKEFDLVSQRLINHYCYCTALDRDTVSQKLLPAHDVFLTADEAITLNLCDKIKYF